MAYTKKAASYETAFFKTRQCAIKLFVRCAGNITSVRDGAVSICTGKLLNRVVRPIVALSLVSITGAFADRSTFGSTIRISDATVDITVTCDIAIGIRACKHHDLVITPIIAL